MQSPTPTGVRRFVRGVAVVSVAAAALALLVAVFLGDRARPGLGVQPPGATTETGGALPDQESPPSDVAPDWTVVQEYLDTREVWKDRSREFVLADVPEDEKQRLRQEWLDERPNIEPAISAASAIVDAGGGHDRIVEAAEFLVAETGSLPDADEHLSRAARTLAAHAPARSLQALRSLADGRLFESDAQRGDRVQALFEELAFGDGDPVPRAAARYYLASGLRRTANYPLAPPAPGRREAARKRAIEVATGLSAGVEDEDFAGATLSGPSRTMAVPTSAPTGTAAFADALRDLPDVLRDLPDVLRGLPGVRNGTFAEAESDLLHRIRHATVGGTVSEHMTGKRLDGVEDRLTAYQGRVVLLDFWATWCKPCVAALPDLRALVAELPADRFALVAISADMGVNTVTDFLEREPMPWTNWHAGIVGEVVRTWDVSTFPTYVLIDETGVILARTNALGDRLTSLIRETVEGAADTSRSGS